MIKEYSFEDGKYKVYRNEDTYETSLFRHGEYWEAGTESVVGDKMFHSMLNEIETLKHYEKLYTDAVEACSVTGYNPFTTVDKVIRGQAAEIIALKEYEYMYNDLCK